MDEFGIADIAHTQSAQEECLMKSILSFSPKMCCAVVLSTRAAAGIIAFDNFDYSDGSLVLNGAGKLTVAKRVI
ncbi:MAG: hypothetical protein ACI9DH_000211 [Halioglobus sp.]|jgi:hypothetical protein